MDEIVAIGIGGTHARFALAELHGDSIRLHFEQVFRTSEHDSLDSAWIAYANSLGRPLPRAASLSVACPVRGDTLRLTNNPWVIRPGDIARKHGLERVSIVNDFSAVSHAVARLGSEMFHHLHGPDEPLPDEGMISVLGPGTGLGVSSLMKGSGGYVVTSTEGGHIGFAPTDEFEDRLLARLRAQYGRVSVERIVSGPGLVQIYETLAGEGARGAADDKALWTAALEQRDERAAEALLRFCAILGSVAGDIALAQGATAVVVAGGLGLRLVDRLATSDFASRFVAKGRFEPLMRTIPVKAITHPQPGLVGAAAAFIAEA